MTSCKTKRGGMGSARAITSAAKNSFERLIIVLQNFISMKKFIAVKKLLFESKYCNKSCHKEINQISILTIHTTLDCFKLIMLIIGDFNIIVSSLKTTSAESIAKDINKIIISLDRLMSTLDDDFDDVDRKRLEDAYLNAFNEIEKIENQLFELKNLMERDSSVLSSLTDKTDITEDLKQEMIDLLDRNLQLLREVTFPSIAMSVEQFLIYHGDDKLKTFQYLIKKEQKDNPERVSRQQSLLRARRDARTLAQEQGRSVSPPIGFENDTGEYEDPPFEYPENDDLDIEHALNFPEKGRGRKSRKRNNSTRMFKKHKKQKKQILTTRKRNKIRTSTRRG